MTAGELYFVNQLGRGELHYVAATGKLWRTARQNQAPLRKVNYLAGAVGNHGYVWLISRDVILDTNVCAAAHRVIWEYFVGAIPPEYEINHKNFDRCDNRLSNLEVVTRAENQQHMRKYGMYAPPCGNSHWNCRISDVDLRSGREKYLAGEVTLVALAATLGIGAKRLSWIFSGKVRGLFPNASQNGTVGRPRKEGFR